MAGSAGIVLNTARNRCAWPEAYNWSHRGAGIEVVDAELAEGDLQGGAITARSGGPGADSSPPRTSLGDW